MQILKNVKVTGVLEIFSNVKVFMCFHYLLYVAGVICIWFLCSMGGLYMLVYVFYIAKHGRNVFDYSGGWCEH